MAGRSQTELNKNTHKLLAWGTSLCTTSFTFVFSPCWPTASQWPLFPLNIAKDQDGGTNLTPTGKTGLRWQWIDECGKTAHVGELIISNPFQGFQYYVSS